MKSPADLNARVGPATLSVSGLQFLWGLLETHRPRRVIEFGSGLTTLLFALANRELHLNAQILSVEHNVQFAKRTRAEIHQAELADWITLVHAPLRPARFASRVYLTYSPRVMQAIAGFDASFVLIDGPQEQYRREASLFVARRAVAPGAVVVLDDFERHWEQHALSVWQSSLALSRSP